MHELSLAQSVLEVALDYAEKQIVPGPELLVLRRGPFRPFHGKPEGFLRLLV